jgi:phosphatidate cytidylyltransferase
MLRTRVITALVLVTCFLLAVFWLPALAWGLLTLAAILLAAHEWSALAAFSPGVEFAFILVLATCGALLLFAPPHSAALYIYGAAMLFWFVATPLWFYSGWKPVTKWLAAVVGVLILLPAWLALVELREQGVFWLLGAMALVWIADLAA